MKNVVIIIGGGESFENDEKKWKFLNFGPIYYNKIKKVEKKVIRWKNELMDNLDKNLFTAAIYPVMPCLDNAKYIDWKTRFERVLMENIEINEIKKSDKIILHLVGHSLGGNFLQKYLGENNLESKFNFKIGSVHFVAPCISAGDFGETENWENISNQCGNINIYHSKDDIVVPMQESRYYKKMLPKSKLFAFDNYGHFNETPFLELAFNLNNFLD